MKADIIIAVGQHLIWVSINGRGNSIPTKSDTKLRALLFNTVLKYIHAHKWRNRKMCTMQPSTLKINVLQNIFII